MTFNGAPDDAVDPDSVDDEHTPESGHRSDAQNIIEIINDARDDRSGVLDPASGPDNRTLDYRDREDRMAVRTKMDGLDEEPMLPGFGPLGHGGNARDDCGDKHPFVCDECGHSVPFGRTCGQSVCARCAPTWVRDRAINKVAKMRRVRREIDQNTPDDEHQKFHHFVVTPPLRWWASLAKAGYSLREALDETDEVVGDILDELRARGVRVRHSFRGEAEDGELADEEGDWGEWKKRLFKERSWWGDVRDELAWMPHYHNIVVCDRLQCDTAKVEEQTGWVLHRIQRDADNDDVPDHMDNVSLWSDGDMASAMIYCFSHADVHVNPQGHNRSQIEEVGAFRGSGIANSGRFSPWDSDIDWAEAKVRQEARETLGLNSVTTDCGQDLPAVDDPDGLAHDIFEQIYPGNPGVEPDVDGILEHVAAGNISVSVSSTSGGGQSVTVRDAWGHKVGSGGLGGSPADMPDSPGGSAASGAAMRELDAGDDHDRAVDGDQDVDARDDQDDCDCGCDGTMIPLGAARERGLFEDPEWLRQAAYADEALDAHREHDDDLETWYAESPGRALPAPG